MKVLLSAYGCEPGKGGEFGFGWNWAWHLAELGHKVWVITRLCGQEAIEQTLASQPMPNLRFVYIDDPAWPKRYIKNKIAIFIQYFVWQKRAYSVALRLNQECEFDLVHHVSWGTITGGSWLWRLNRPFVFGPVGGGQIAPSAFKEYFVEPGRWRMEVLRSLTVKRLVPFNPSLHRLLSRTDLVLATNRDTFNLAQRLSARRVELFLDTSLTQDYFPPEPPIRSTSPELRILWVASFYPRKAFPLALEALAKVNPLMDQGIRLRG